jgi:DNA-binding NarL/FixJ family response regulator
MKDNKIRVLIADDHPSMRMGIKAIIQSDPRFEVVGEAGTGQEVIDRVNDLGPDVLLLDMEMPEGNGIEVTKTLTAAGTTTRILAFSSYKDPSYVRGVYGSGAHGYVTKNKDSAVLLEAIAAVAAGEERWFVPTKPKAGPIEEAGLSKREADVLKLLAKGKTNASIGNLLNVSEHSVKNTLTSVYSKLGVANAREAISWAWESGLVKGDRA